MDQKFWAAIFAIVTLLNFTPGAWSEECILEPLALDPSLQIEIATTATNLDYKLNKELIYQLSGLDSPHGDETSIPIKFTNQKFTKKDMDRFLDPQFDVPETAGVLMLFRAPETFSLKDCGQNKIELSQSNGNNLIHPLASINKDSLNSYFNGNSKDVKIRNQSVKGIGQTSNFKIEKGDCDYSFSVSASTFRLLGKPGNNPLAYLASDEVIENFHNYKGYQDPYHRREFMNQAWASLSDGNGNKLELVEGRTYVLPIRIRLDAFKQIGESDSRINLNYGVQAAIPVSAPFGDASVGVHSNIKATQRFAGNWAAMVGAGLGINIQTHVFGNKYNPTDDKYTLSTNGAVALGIVRADQGGSGATSFVVALTDNSPLLKKSKYMSYGTNTTFLNKQSESAQFDRERAIVIAIQRTWGNNTIGCHIREDIRIIKGRINKNGNNNEDFRVGCKYSREF